MHWWAPYPKVRWSPADNRCRSNRSPSSKCRGSRLAVACTISSREPAGMRTPPTSASRVEMRRQAATEPTYRRHSSTAFGMRPGSAQRSAQRCLSSSSSFTALLPACAVVSWAATMPAIMIECR